MINYNILTLFSEYQTISILFISTFLTIICLATKKSVEKPKSPSPVFNILPNDTLIDSNDNEIETISLSKQLKSKIPVRKNQINNSITSINSYNNSFSKIIPKNSITVINEKNNFRKLKQKDEDLKVNKNSLTVLNGPLNNSTPINNISTNNVLKSDSSKEPQRKITKPINQETTNILKPSQKQTIENSNEEISEIVNLDSEVSRINYNDSISKSSFPRKNKIITTFPAKAKILNPPRINTEAVSEINDKHQEDSVSQLIDPPKNRKVQNIKPKSDLTPIQIPQPIPMQKIQPSPLSVTIPSANDINRFNNSIIAIDGTIQVKAETEKSLTIGTTKPITKGNINKPFSPPTNELADNKPIKLVSKLKKSNLAKDKSNYRLLQTENPIRKNKKSVKFHNKVEVWARTPTFLYSDKSFLGINKEPEYYDDFGDSDNPRLREPIVKPTRAIIIENEPNSYSSRLKSKLEAKYEPKYTPTTTRRASSFPVNSNSKGYMRSEQEDSKRHQFLHTPSPIPGPNENARPTVLQTTIRKPFKKVSSAPTK